MWVYEFRGTPSEENTVAGVAWGLLGPETLANERRTRTLDLGAGVRAFNDLAVPGLGGVWFGKELLLATIGVAIGERVRNSGQRAQNIEVANAVEALACWLALGSNGWKRDPRLRSALKLSGKNDLSFATARKRSFYVTQPMRQATANPVARLCKFKLRHYTRFDSTVLLNTINSATQCSVMLPSRAMECCH
jgi:hypothetical protein